MICTEIVPVICPIKAPDLQNVIVSCVQRNELIKRANNYKTKTNECAIPVLDHTDPQKCGGHSPIQHIHNEIDVPPPQSRVRRDANSLQ